MLEAGPTVGTAPRSWGDVRMFSPWRYNIDKACRALLDRHGWAGLDLEKFPTGRDLAMLYLEPLARTPEARPASGWGTRVHERDQSRFG